MNKATMPCSIRKELKLLNNILNSDDEIGIVRYAAWLGREGRMEEYVEYLNLAADIREFKKEQAWNNLDIPKIRSVMRMGAIGHDYLRKLSQMLNDKIMGRLRQVCLG